MIVSCCCVPADHRSGMPIPSDGRLERGWRPGSWDAGNRQTCDRDHTHQAALRPLLDCCHQASTVEEVVMSGRPGRGRAYFSGRGSALMKSAQSQYRPTNVPTPAAIGIVQRMRPDDRCGSKAERLTTSTSRPLRLSKQTSASLPQYVCSVPKGDMAPGRGLRGLSRSSRAGVPLRHVSVDAPNQ